MGWFGVLRGHPRSSAMSPFDGAHVISYSFNRASFLYRFRNSASYLSKFANFDLPHLHLASPLGMSPFEFRKDFWHQNTRVPGLPCGVVYVIQRLAVLVELRLVADGHTDTQTQGHGIYHTENSSCCKNRPADSCVSP